MAPNGERRRHRFARGRQRRPDSTSKKRIIDAAERLFAQKGFRETTVRDMAAEAGCNVSAVSYYFRGKEALYRTVFQRRARMVRDRSVGRLEQLFEKKGKTVTLEMLLSEFVGVLLEPFMVDPPERVTAGLMTHESQDPHVPEDVYKESLVDPITNAMKDSLRRICPGLSDEQLYSCIESVIAQVSRVAVNHGQHMGTGNETLLADVKKSVRHIVDFSAAGIRQYASDGNR